MKLGPYELDQIYTGDARELAKAIPDEGVDLIFTDPPYPKEFLPLYGWLAIESARILRDGGLLFVYCGKAWIDRILLDMTKSLNYFWLGCIWTPGHSHMVYNLELGETWRPFLIFSKGKGSLNYRLDGVSANGKQKEYHEWQQDTSAPLYYLNCLANEYSIILDPFTGGGTVPAVCKMLGRHYLAFEIDPDTAERARQRVANTQPPLFVPQPEQLELEAMA